MDHYPESAWKPIPKRQRTTKGNEMNFIQLDCLFMTPLGVGCTLMRKAVKFGIKFIFHYLWYALRFGIGLPCGLG